MSRVLQVKRGAKANLPTLAQGEFGFVTDTGEEELYIGTGSDNIQIAREDAVVHKSSMESVTLFTSRWSSTGIYTLSLDSVSNTTIQEILPGLSITEEQLSALQAANIQDGGQAAGTITLKAFGDVPAVDIPIRVIVRRDM